jgi:murein DD-endopeptidase MepM/ murein hydrolase activator NlpD
VPPPNLASDLLAEAAAEVGVAQAALLAAQARLSASQVALAAARAALEQAKAEDQAAREALAGAVLSERKAERAVADVKTRIGDTRETLGAVAREAYQGGNLSTLSVVLEAETPAEFADRLTSMRAVLEAGDSALATLATDQAELAANEDRLSAVRALREELADESARRLATTKQAEEKAAAAEHEQRSVVEVKAAALKAAEAARAADLSKYQAFLSTSNRLGARVVGFSSQLRTSRSAVTGTGAFVRPGTGQVTSPFGQRFHPILGYWKLHTGTDIGYGDGTVYAADQGTVVIAGYDRGYGNMLVVDHGIINGKPLATLYAHQAGFLVGVGDVVRKGQPIGRIGSTGMSTGPHLHFEVRAAGAVIDPWPWLVAAPRP